jgi:alpha-1,6-mannosyltransferase
MRVKASYGLAATGAVLIGLTVATPFVFKAYGDNAFIASTITAGLLSIVATNLAEREPAGRVLLLVFGIGIALRAYVFAFPPLLSSDIYRYVWDGEVQAAGINPYRYFPADQAVAFLRDGAIFPHINRVDTAATIYPPVAQFFFFAATRFGATIDAMRLAMLGCDALTVVAIVVLLRRMGHPVARVTAYLWHPLPLWEVANSGHVDALMVALLLVALCAASAGRELRGSVFIALAVLVKPYVAPVLAAIWRPWDIRMPMIVTSVLALCYLPYLSVGWGVFGYLTHGYLAEEGISAGYELWLLSLWRLVVGTLPGDVPVYGVLAASALLVIGLVAAQDRRREIASMLATANMMLLVTLLLLSPNYPWYFLVIVPFVALCGGAATWFVSIAALSLSEQLDWDFYIPRMVTKSVLFGGLLLIWSLAAWRRHRSKVREVET